MVEQPWSDRSSIAVNLMLTRLLSHSTRACEMSVTCDRQVIGLGPGVIASGVYYFMYVCVC